MAKPHHEIPSQRLAMSKTSIRTATADRPQRSVWWLVAIWLLGWLLVAYPAVLLSLLSYLLIVGSTGESPTASSVTIGLLGMVFALCMIATPILLGLAVMKRRRGLWVATVVTGVVSIIAFIYLLVEWMIPFG